MFPTYLKTFFNTVFYSVIPYKNNNNNLQLIVREFSIGCCYIVKHYNNVEYIQRVFNSNRILYFIGNYIMITQYVDFDYIF